MLDPIAATQGEIVAHSGHPIRPSQCAKTQPTVRAGGSSSPAVRCSGLPERLTDELWVRRMVLQVLHPHCRKAQEADHQDHPESDRGHRVGDCEENHHQRHHHRNHPRKQPPRHAGIVPFRNGRQAEQLSSSARPHLLFTALRSHSCSRRRRTRERFGDIPVAGVALPGMRGAVGAPGPTLPVHVHGFLARHGGRAFGDPRASGGHRPVRRDARDHPNSMTNASVAESSVALVRSTALTTPASHGPQDTRAAHKRRSRRLASSGDGPRARERRLMDWPSDNQPGPTTPG